MQYKYQQLMNDLLSELILGKRLPGTALPSEQEIARSYKLSRVSVRHAIDCLLKEGFLEKSRTGRNVIRGIPVDNAKKNLLLILRNQNAVLPDIYRMIYEALLLKCSFAGISLFCCSEENLADMSSSKRSYDAVMELGNTNFPKKKLDSNRFILLDDVTEDKTCCVATDNFAGGVMAAEHLIQCGYRRPLFFGIADVESYMPFRKRMQGFCSRMEEAGIPVSCRYAPNSSALSALVTLLSWPELKKADSMFAVHDYFAVNVYHALQEMKISIPGDLAVIGFDGLPSGAYLLPPLTTLVQPVNRIADKALELALSEEKPADNILLPPELLIRESTEEKV